MNHDQAQGIYVALCDQWPHMPIAGEVETWARYLRGVPFDVASAAVTQLGHRRSSMPSTSDFAEAVALVREARERQTEGRRRTYAEIGITYIEEARARLGGEHGEA